MPDGVSLSKLYDATGSSLSSTSVETFFIKPNEISSTLTLPLPDVSKTNFISVILFQISDVFVTLVFPSINVVMSNVTSLNDLLFAKVTLLFCICCPASGTTVYVLFPLTIVNATDLAVLV